MATWTTLPDATLEPGKPIRSIDVLALRDNPVAIAEGASGAPKILDAALGPTVTSAGTTWVQNRIAGSIAGAVGAYSFLGAAISSNITIGSTMAGSSLRYATSAEFGVLLNGAPSGTWRCMGNQTAQFAGSNEWYATATLWLRIA